MKGERGSVLVQVLITTVVVSTIAAGLMQLALLSYTVTARAAGSAALKKRAESSFNALMVQWNLSGVCTSLAGEYNCVLAGINCTCTPTGTDSPVVTAQNAGGSWTVSVNVPDP